HSITGYLETQMYYPSMCPPYLPGSVGLACGAVLLCVSWLVWPQSRVVGALIACCKAVYAAAALFGVSRHGGTQATLLFFTPWVWIWTLPYPVASSTDRRGAVRAFLALLAAWHVLLPFPIAGSQVPLGTFLLTAVG